jgi:hypothetical protein
VNGFPVGLIGNIPACAFKKDKNFKKKEIIGIEKKKLFVVEVSATLLN